MLAACATNIHLAASLPSLVDSFHDSIALTKQIMIQYRDVTPVAKLPFLIFHPYVAWRLSWDIFTMLIILYTLWTVIHLALSPRMCSIVYLCNAKKSLFFVYAHLHTHTHTNAHTHTHTHKHTRTHTHTHTHTHPHPHTPTHTHTHTHTVSLSHAQFCIYVYP